ncbi:lipoprotein-releasing system ATP-binding protein [Brevundimonas faecalis]|uniref:Lipoprotein-releasing system ATP-binding protein n=1 Tax=Brevundimonas faecalis TaxID=947378 RepID=A0ABV2REV8_9CAUL
MNSSLKSVAPTLRLRGIIRTYPTASGGLTVLKGVDLDIMPGEVVGLIGPSGSGKSSLLHAAGLLERPTNGQVMIDGEDVGGLDERARTRLRLSRIGFVYQFHHLLPEFDARDNVALPMRIAGHSEAEARRRAEALLTSLGLGERFTHQPAQLSGGEQQRVAIARSLANNPRLLLADEPTGNLDPANSHAVFDSLRELAKTTGVAALIATHNMELAGHMDRVFALKDGHLEERAAESQAY